MRWLENEVEVDVRAPIALEEHARLPRAELRAPKSKMRSSSSVGAVAIGLVLIEVRGFGDDAWASSGEPADAGISETSWRLRYLNPLSRVLLHAMSLGFVHGPSTTERRCV